jgi:hypothetical protein
LIEHNAVDFSHKCIQISGIVHSPPVKATTIWAATQSATVSRNLPTDCPTQEHKSVLISGFRRNLDETCGLLGYYAASCGNCLVNNYHTMPRNTPEDHRFHKSVFLTTEICSLQDNIRPFPLSQWTSSSTKSQITILWHLCARAACLQLSAQDEWGVTASAVGHRTYACSRVLSLSKNTYVCVFLPQHIILTPTGTSSDMHFYTLHVISRPGLRTITWLPISVPQYSTNIPWRTFLFS